MNYVKKSRRRARLWLALFVMAIMPPVPAAVAGKQQALISQFIQGTGFSAWRPYSNSNRLVSVGMNKGEVLAIAGKPDLEESYYHSAGSGLVRVSDWYYVRTGHDPETTLLKFIQEALVSITSTPTR